MANPMTDAAPASLQPGVPLSYGPADVPQSGRMLVLLAAFLGWMFDGLEMGIFPQIAKPALTNLLCR